MNTINESKKTINYKVIMLVIASYDNIYSSIIETWKKCIRAASNDVKIYLLYCRDDLEEEMYIDEEESTIFYKCEESFIPGIFLKSIHSMDYCHKTFKYDYLVRTNLSSFYNIPKMLDFLNEQPNSGFAGGVHGVSYNISFICGAGIIMSRDVVEKVLKSALEENKTNTVCDLPDDVVLSYLINLHVDPMSYTFVPRFDIHEKLTKEKIDELSEYYFHFRNRNDAGNRVLDSQNMEFLQSVLALAPC